MLINSSLILILFILPEVKDFSNRKPCDIINLGRSSEPETSDSVSQGVIVFRFSLNLYFEAVWPNLGYCTPDRGKSRNTGKGILSLSRCIFSCTDVA